MNKLSFKIVVLLGTCFIFGVIQGRAQLTTGTIVGSVTDPSGAIIPSARLTITNLDTGISRSVQTNGDGMYTATNLRPGHYTVKASMQGFQSQTKAGLILAVDQKLEVDFTLKPGVQTQKVTIVGRSAQLVQTATSSLGQIIGAHAVGNLPLNGRNYQQLISLTAGVAPAAEGAHTEGHYVINGGRGTGNLFLVDGVDVTNSFNDPTRINPSLAAISQFRVITNNFSAEYGRATGGIVSVQIKGGTNQLHGSVFEFLRNEDLDGRNFFAPHKLPFKENQFGFSVGGPIKKDRTFFFGDYQGTRLRYSGEATYGAQPPTGSATGPGLFTVPSLAMRNGDFSAKLPDTQIYDPTTSPPSPFPNNIIPPDRFDHAAAYMLSLLPLPNHSGPFNYISDLPATYNADAFDMRIDHYLGRRDSVYGSYSFNNVNGRTQPPFGQANGFLITNDYPHNRTNRADFHYTHTFGAEAVNDLVLAYARDRWFGPPAAGQHYNPDLGIPYLNTSPGDTATAGLPLVDIPGYAIFGGPAGAPYEFATNLPQVDDSFSWTKGRHLFKTGFTFIAREFNADINVFPRGFYIPLSLTTSFYGAGGDGLASFLLGYPYIAERTQNSPYGLREKEYGAYFQDTWKTTNRLTLNLGLRYDLFPAPTEAFNRQSNYDMRTRGMIVAGQNGVSNTGNVHTNSLDFGPHVGFSYALTGNKLTVIRGGYGIAYQPLGSAGAGVTDSRLPANPPFANNFSEVLPFIHPTLKISDGLPIPAPNLTNPSGDITYIPSNEPPTYVQFWNFDVQRALPASILLDVAYSGSRGVHLPGVVNLNQAPPGPGSPSTRSPISASINSLNALLNYAGSSYNALEVKVERHFFKGFYLLGAYTYSKSLDNDSADSSSDASNASSGEPQNSFDWAAEYAPSDFDVRHRFVVSYVYELPFGKGQRFFASSHGLLNALLMGWQVNGITTLQSGNPFTPVVANPATNAGPGGAIRPDRIGSGQLPSSQRNVNRWFDVTDFAAPVPFHFGNSGRNILYGPGLVNFDFSLFRHIPITERVNLEFRTEVFNIFNHPNFGLPNASIDTPQAGIITSARDPRQIQFALQLQF